MIIAVSLLVFGFVTGLYLRKVLPNLCAICFSVSSSWLILLYLLFRGAPVDRVATALLMGGSAVGLMYYLGGKIKDSYQIFKFPFLVTAFALAYTVVLKSIEWQLIALVSTLWLVFAVIHGFSEKGLKRTALKLIECCKNW